MRQRGGCLWLLVGLFLAVVAGGLAFTAMLRATSVEPATQVEPRRAVVIVARDVPPHTELTAEDLIVKEIPLSAIPDNAVRELEAAVGKVTTSELVAGEILLKPRIAELGERGPRLNFKLEPGKVVMAFPADDLLSKSGALQPGDIVDILYSIEIVPTETTAARTSGAPEVVTFWALQQVPISAIVLSPEVRGGAIQGQSEAQPQSILLALDPQDALVLKHLKDSGGIVDIVLRAREDETEYKTEPVNPPYLQEEYNLPR